MLAIKECQQHALCCLAETTKLGLDETLYCDEEVVQQIKSILQSAYSSRAEQISQYSLYLEIGTAQLLNQQKADARADQYRRRHRMKLAELSSVAEGYQVVVHGLRTLSHLCLRWENKQLCLDHSIIPTAAQYCTLFHALNFPSHCSSALLLLSTLSVDDQGIEKIASSTVHAHKEIPLLTAICEIVAKDRALQVGSVITVSA